MVIKELRRAAEMLKNSETPLLDARVLLSYVTGQKAPFLTGPLSADEAARFFALTERRAAGEPIAYILGEKEFMGLSFSLNRDTLIPRPDTETVVEYLLEKYKGKIVNALDLCCGSGCIGLSLCHYLPGSHVVLADIAEGALEASRKNAERLGLKDRSKVIRLDVLSEDFAEGFDIIVSNPPYIRSDELCSLAAAKTEPLLALDGGKSGLDFYHSIAPKAYKALKNGGVLAFEIGFDQSEAVKEIMEKSGFTSVIAKKDYGGNFRLVAGEKP